MLHELHKVSFRRKSGLAYFIVRDAIGVKICGTVCHFSVHKNVLLSRRYHRVTIKALLMDMAYMELSRVSNFRRATESLNHFAKEVFNSRARTMGGRHSSVVSSAHTILQPWVQIPSTPSKLFQFVLLKLYRENDENQQKEAGIGPFF